MSTFSVSPILRPIAQYSSPSGQASWALVCVAPEPITGADATEQPPAACAGVASSSISPARPEIAAIGRGATRRIPPPARSAGGGAAANGSFDTKDPTGSGGTDHAGIPWRATGQTGD